ncbi:serine hydrolase domain-containing protein [Microvirga zambiensis]|uniref:serine hydrolase domain-containing protein n=1 Tax=Microvirga zambiensis TaxID=1402137 RepID=UPI00191D1551|nr:serine hydrolase domain-containing protein [Microvirga zambiensis]
MVEAWASIEDGCVVGARDSRRIVPWWSFTKTVLAAAALSLVRDGAVALDEPLEGKPYTLRHLLQHRSGLTNYGGFRPYHEAVERGDEPWQVPHLLDRLDADRLRYPVGEGWAYSNIGYLFVARQIEVATGADIGEALQRLVLKPLGIEGACFARTRADLDSATMGNAAGYHPGWVYHGLLVGPVEEAAYLLDRLFAGDLLPSDLKQEMLSPLVLPGPVPGRPWAIPGYGLGVMTGQTTGGLKVVGHTGGGPGSTIAVYRKQEQGNTQTAAYFRTSENEACTEEEAFALLRD